VYRIRAEKLQKFGKALLVVVEPGSSMRVFENANVEPTL
jgi:hypothetical protein